MNHTWYAPIVLGLAAWALSRLGGGKHVDTLFSLAKLALLSASQGGVLPLVQRCVSYPWALGEWGSDRLWDSLFEQLLLASVAYHLLRYGLSTALVHNSHAGALLLYSAFYSAAATPRALIYSVGAFELCTLALLVLPVRQSLLKLSVFGTVRVLLWALLVHAHKERGLYLLSTVLAAQLLMAYELGQMALRISV